MPAFLLSAIGPITSVLGSVMSTISGVLQTAAKLVMSAVQTIAKGLTVVGGLVVKGAMMFANVMMKVVQNAMAYAKSVNDLRLSTGMGMKEAGATSMKFGAFGISPQMLAQARGNEHHSITKMRGQAWGVDVNDPMSINRKARSFGDSIGGHAQREAMLESVGMNNDKGRWMASLSEEQMQDQMNFTQKTGAALGISPESMSKMAEALPLAQAKLESFLQLVQLKFVDTALPLIEKGIATVSDFITANAPMISQTLTDAFNWIFTEGPVIAMNGVQSMLDTFKWLSDMFFSVADTVIAFLGTLESSNSGLGLWVGIFLATIDYISVGIKGAVEAFAVLGAMIYNIIYILSEVSSTIQSILLGIVKTVVGAFSGVSASLWRVLGLDGVADTITGANEALQSFEVKSIGDVTGMGLQSPKDALDLVDKVIPTSDLSGSFRNVQNSGEIGKLRDSATEKLNNAKGAVDTAFNKVQGVVTTVSKSVNNNKEVVQGNKQADENGEAIRKATEKTADNTDPKKQEKANTPGMQDWLGRFAMERSRQRYLMETR